MLKEPFATCYATRLRRPLLRIHALAALVHPVHRCAVLGILMYEKVHSGSCAAHGCARVAEGRMPEATAPCALHSGRSRRLQEVPLGLRTAHWLVRCALCLGLFRSEEHTSELQS